MNRQRVGHRYGLLRAAGVFTLGAAIGSVGALLFAPASGRMTRQRIGKRIQKFQRAATQQLGHTKKLLVEKAEDVRDAAAERLGHARTWLATRMNGNGRRSLRRRAVHHV